MASYMPQDVFDMSIVTIVRLHVSAGNSLDDLCTMIWQGYERSYRDDVNCKHEMRITSGKLLEMMQTQFKKELIPSVMLQLQFCIVNYEPDGKRRRKKLLGGTFFNRMKSPNPNRSEDCLANMCIYHLGTTSGKFPLAPKGWSLENR
jgi:hypothetical protein